MKIDEALAQFKPRFDQIIGFQTLLMNANETNFEETKAILYQLKPNSNKHTFCHFLESIDSAIYARPKFFRFYIDIILHFKESIQNYFSQYELYRIFGNHIVVYHLYLNSLFDLSFINNIKKNSESIESLYNCLIKENDSTFNKADFESKCFNGENPDPIAIAIKNDDLSSLQTLLSKANISPNSTISYSIYEISYFLSFEPSLIEYAAFFGSLNCFKYLLLQSEVNLTKSLSNFAVAGGNYDIIHLIESKEIPFTLDDLNCAIQFFRNDIAEYLIDTNNINDIDHESIFTSVAFYNVEYFVNHINDITNINILNRFKSSLLQTAAYYGQFDFVEFLVTIDNINITMKSSMNKTAKEIAEEFGENEIAEFLAKFDKS